MGNVFFLHLSLASCGTAPRIFNEKYLRGLWRCCLRVHILLKGELRNMRSQSKGQFANWAALNQKLLRDVQRDVPKRMGLELRLNS